MVDITQYDNVRLSKNIGKIVFNGKDYNYASIEMNSYNGGKTWSCSLHGCQVKINSYYHRKRITYKRELTEAEAQDWLNLIKVKLL